MDAVAVGQRVDDGGDGFPRLFDGVASHGPGAIQYQTQIHGMGRAVAAWQGEAGQAEGGVAVLDLATGGGEVVIQLEVQDQIAIQHGLADGKFQRPALSDEARGMGGARYRRSDQQAGHVDRGRKRVGHGEVVAGHFQRIEIPAAVTWAVHRVQDQPVVLSAAGRAPLPVSPLPWWLQTTAIVFSVAMLVPVRRPQGA
ncbi:hypothetical protein [Rhodanobacter lindaniclasticus]